MTNGTQNIEPHVSGQITIGACYATVPSSIKHPATYTESFIPKFAELLSGCKNVLDPFGGVGKLALIKQYGFTGKVVCNELEPEWGKVRKIQRGRMEYWGRCKFTICELRI